MNENRRYKIEKIKSASDLEALIMLYDEAVFALEEAHKFFEKGEQGKFLEKVEWVEKIITGLISIINFEIAPEIAYNLYRLYEYLLRRLMVAKSLIMQTPKIIEECRDILKSIRDAWSRVKENGDITEEFKITITSYEKSFLNIEI